MIGVPPETTVSTSLTVPRNLQQPQQQQNRTLVIIMGNLRGGEIAWQTLYDNVLDVNRADLALMIGRSTQRNSSLYKRANYLWEFDEYDDWADAVDLINGTAWRQTLPPLLHRWSSILGGVKLYKYQGSGAVIFMIRWFLAQELRRSDALQRYDRFVLTRSDHYYLCRHDLSQLDDQSMWIPKGQDNRGITDRHLVVSSADVLTALDVLPPLLAHPTEYAPLLARRSGNPEKLLLRQWRRAGLEHKIRRFPRVMFTCAADGDMTRWKSMSSHVVAEGVHLKYLQEYNDSHVTCAERK